MMKKIKKLLEAILRRLARITLKNRSVNAPMMIEAGDLGQGFFTGFIEILDALHEELAVNGADSHPYIFLYNDLAGEANFWDCFLEQPFRFSDEEAQEFLTFRGAKRVFRFEKFKYAYQSVDSKHVKVMNKRRCYYTSRMPNSSMDFLTNPVALKWWRDFIQKYVHWNAETKAHFDSVAAALLPPGERILGVLLRGSDYSGTRPYDHPIPPSAEQAVADIRQVMENQKFDRIFLASEDQKIVDAMQQAFGERVIVAPQKRYDSGNKNLYLAYVQDTSFDAYRLNLDYITAMVMLGKCQGLMACRTTGTVAAVLLAETPFEYISFWNIGKYQTQEYNFSV